MVCNSFQKGTRLMKVQIDVCVSWSPSLEKTSFMRLRFWALFFYALSPFNVEASPLQNSELRNSHVKHPLNL